MRKRTRCATPTGDQVPDALLYGIMQLHEKIKRYSLRGKVAGD